MKLSNVVRLTEAHREPVMPPSAVHVAFVRLLAEVSGFAASTGHPLVRVFQAVIPNALNDIAEIPSEQLADFCRRMGDMLVKVADAENTPVPTLMEMIEEQEQADGESRPALAQKS